MTEIVVRPVRFTTDVPAMQSFLELIGLRPWIVTDRGGWSDMACGGGRVALHDAASSTSGAPSGQTTLCFEADDLAQLAKQLIAADVAGVTIYDEAYGRVLTCLDPDGATIAIDERQTDLYGSQLRAEPGAPESLRVMPVRFADPAGPHAGFLQALGLQPAGELNPYYVNFLAGGGAQGQVGLHHVFSDKLPVVPGGGGAVVQLTFQSGEPLEQIAARFTAAGFEPTIITEDFGSLLSVVDPDGQEVQVHTPAPGS
jgi:catechol 2,3-dioxygenase-like lactoylglutathione lyase family enzyme